VPEGCDFARAASAALQPADGENGQAADACVTSHTF
jgi:hypothetical protein